MPRKARANVRAALRFAHVANDERGLAHCADADARRTIRISSIHGDFNSPQPQSPPTGTLWDETASHATVTNVTIWIQASRGQRTPLWTRIRLYRLPILASHRTAAAPSGPTALTARWSTDEH